MIRRLTIVAAAVLLGFLAWLPVPVSVGAQGGDAVYRSLRLQIPLAREYMEPNGLQDAASDLLTSNMDTTSSTYSTLLSAAVTVGEAGDAVLVHVRAGFSTGVNVGGGQSHSCSFRITRETTEIQFFTVNDGSQFLWDSTEVDSPPVGTHTYSVEMRSNDPTVTCDIISSTPMTIGAPLWPVPSLLVQSFYAGSIP